MDGSLLSPSTFGGGKIHEEIHYKQRLEDRHTLLDSIKSCSKEKDLHKARILHNDILQRSWLSEDICINNALLSLYAKCGDLSEALKIFDGIPLRNVVSWNCLVSAYTEHKHIDKAIVCFRKMQNEGVSPNAITYICLLKACGGGSSKDHGIGLRNDIECVSMGEEIHAQIERVFLGQNIELGNALVDMYAKCGSLKTAREVFDNLPVRNVASWNTLISGYVKHGLCDEAIECFRRMQLEGLSPDAITFICILRACGNIGCLEIGKKIHEDADRQGLLEKNIVLGTTLVDMYAKCGMLEEAQEICDKLPIRNAESWTALISGYSQYGFGHKAVLCFRKMLKEGISPSVVALISILKACGNIGTLELGEDIYLQAKEEGLLKKDDVVQIALVDMYAKCGALEKAQKVFDELPIKSVEIWTSLMAGYNQHGLSEKAIFCFNQMQNEGFYPDAITFICILKACGNIGSLKLGGEIHEEVRKQSLLEKDIVLGTALVDMYGKCGNLKKAQEVFNELPIQNATSWTALMAGHAQMGEAERVLSLLNKMMDQNVIPDVVSILVVLNACSHSGLVEQGQMVFEKIATIHESMPTLEHYICMVDLLGRAGRFDKALIVVEKLPYLDRLPLWLALLGACCKWANVEFGLWVFEQSSELDRKCPAAYLCMANIYAAAGLKLGK